MLYKMKNVDWRRMFDSALDPFFMHDKDFRLILANRAYLECAGVSEEVIGKLYWEVFPKGSGPTKSCLEVMNRQGGRGGRRGSSARRESVSFQKRQCCGQNGKLSLQPS